MRTAKEIFDEELSGEPLINYSYDKSKYEPII